MIAQTAAEAVRKTTSNGARYKFGFDIGGTFTDFVLMDVDSGATVTYKVLTTPHEPERAVLDGWRHLLDELSLDGRSVEMAVHGTTLITNALIERDGGVTGLVTTRGFRDVLEMRKEMRYDIYDLLITLPDPLVPRPLRLEVDERLNGRGEVVTPIDLSQLERAKETFVQAGVEAVAVCFLHSFSNPSHERLAGAWFASTCRRLPCRCRARWRRRFGSTSGPRRRSATRTCSRSRSVTSSSSGRGLPTPASSGIST